MTISRASLRAIEGKKVCTAKHNKTRVNILRAESSKNLENLSHILIASFQMWTTCKVSKILNLMIETKD